MSLFLLQLGGELRKLFARKRTYIGFAAFLGVEILVLGLLRLDRVQRTLTRFIEATGYLAEDYMSGLTLALMILMWTVFLLGALYLALVAGDVVSKEVEDGTMRMILSRPASRGRILGIKLLACAVYTLVLVLFIATTALVTGLMNSGTGGLFVFDPTNKIYALYGFEAGLQRYLLAVPLLGLSLFTVTALGFFFSCLNMKPAAATIVTLSLFFVDTIMRNIPYFEGLRNWFLTARMSTWSGVFNYQIPWEQILEDYAWLGGINATLLLLAWMVFERRDFKA